MRHLVRSTLLAFVMLTAGCAEKDAQEPPAGEKAEPRLDGAFVSLIQQPPGAADEVKGAPGAAVDAARVVVLTADGAEVGRSDVGADGSFPAIPIGDNLHAEVRVVAEAAGGERSAAVALLNDVVAPRVSIAEKPPAVDVRAEAAFVFACDEAGCSLACALDGGAFEPCTATETFTVEDGDHELVVRGTDAAGNRSAEVRHAWTVDATGPVTTLESAPAPRTGETTAIFAFVCDEAACSFECALDGAAFAGCTSPRRLEGLAEGDHVFLVRATDSLGNVGAPARHEWTIDLVAPQASILTGPAALVNVDTAAFTFGCDEDDCSFTCALDGGAFAGCSTPLLLTGIADGAHELVVRAVDGAGNVGAVVSHGWTVDTRPPAISLHAAPDASTDSDQATFAFSCDEEGCTTECSLDGAAFAPCTSPARLTGIDAGDHAFVVRGSDPAGNTGEARHGWTVVPFTFAQLAVGDWHNCGITPDGALYCWGSNHAGQLGIGTSGTDVGAPARVGTETDWTQVSIGNSFTCGLRGGALYCWGSGSTGAIGSSVSRSVPTRLGTGADWVSISAGGVHACGLRSNGTLHCWGTNSSGQLGDGTTYKSITPVAVSGGMSWSSVHAGAASTCGITTQNHLYCWGSNEGGMLGDGTTTDRRTPTRVGTWTDWSDAAAGRRHTCGIRSDGSLYCWGDNGYGQLGTGLGTPAAAPTRIGGGWEQVTANEVQTCGKKTSGQIFCWGRNDKGQLGTGDLVDQSTPARVGNASDWALVDAGWEHGCGLTTGGAVRCWGYNRNGQLGLGMHGLSRPEPTPVEGAASWVDLDARGHFGCGITAAGTLHCWGSNESGGVGDGTTVDRSSPVQVGAETDWSEVAVGTAHACAIRGGELWCWGSNGAGQLGDGTTTDRHLPVRVGTAADWIRIEAGDEHTCGLRAPGILHCWGDNADRQLGTGNTSGATAPVQVGAEIDWTELSLGNEHTCAIRAGGALYCWGRDEVGAAGHGTGWFVATPRRVGADGDWVSVAAGGRHTCGIRAAGTLHCWGYNTTYQVGDGSTTQRDAPVEVGGSGWAAVGLGAQHSCAIKSTGALHCWGNNTFGPVGSHDREVPTPTQVGVDVDWSAVAGGTLHTCGLASSGALYCWGGNFDGQLGDGSAFRTEPTRIVAPR